MPAEIDGIATFHFGSMTFTTHSSAGVAAIRAITDSVQALATADATDGVGFFIAANQEGGLIQGLAGTGFDVIPSAVDQGRLDPATLRRMAQRWATELGDAGVNLDLAPVADVVPAGTESRNAPIGKLRREYGADAGRRVEPRRRVHRRDARRRHRDDREALPGTGPRRRQHGLHERRRRHRHDARRS